ncbi:sugar/nucleoside kinase (ribokinase family) [Rhizobium mesoamericanum]|nr:sugar/nucleoside kinase (ribokinase family) [Rhizobium mesoamericanum]
MPNYDVLCIGNAIVDIIAQCDEAFLKTNGIIKGAMDLIDARRADLLYSRMGPAMEASGGSAGNTAAGVASFGGRAAYVGKVSSDSSAKSTPTTCARRASPSTQSHSRVSRGRPDR